MRSRYEAVHVHQTIQLHSLIYSLCDARMLIEVHAGCLLQLPGEAIALKEGLYVSPWSPNSLSKNARPLDKSVSIAPLTPPKHCFILLACGPFRGPKESLLIIRPCDTLEISAVYIIWAVRHVCGYIHIGIARKTRYWHGLSSRNQK